MQNPFEKKPTQLDDIIEELVNFLKTADKNSTEYAHVTDQLVKLYNLRDNTTSKRRVSPDALIGAAASLGGISLILFWEHAHPVVSKALGFVKKA